MEATLMFKDGTYRTLPCKLVKISEDEIILETDLVAAKLWCTEDIQVCLSDVGYEPSENNVNEVMDKRKLWYLNDCTDEDWLTISEAISTSRREGKLTPAKGGRTWATTQAAAAASR